MYNKEIIDNLIKIINQHHGIADKSKLTDIISTAFNLANDRSVYYCKDFGIRFCTSKTKNMSNTVLSLSTLKKYDKTPFIVCIVTPKINYLLLANTTFLLKISHSSQDLRIDNIKGSFNGSDITKNYDNIDNAPENFEKLFNIHEQFSFKDNLTRLVENTSKITGKENKNIISEEIKSKIFNSIKHAQDFIKSNDYKLLNEDLDERVRKVKNDIKRALKIDNINLRGRLIEYLITADDSNEKINVRFALKYNNPIPHFKTEDKLGDYSKKTSQYRIETDIKTKLMFLNSNPKGYNIDKLLKFLSEDDSVYMIYLVGIKSNGEPIMRLCSVFDERLLNINLIEHWAGRNSRGVAQFYGHTLESILNNPNDKTYINREKAEEFLSMLISA